MKVKVGDVVAITFLDHAEGNIRLEGPIRFIAYGRIMGMSREAILLHVWTYPDGYAIDGHPDNVKSFVIVRKAILNIDRLIKARGV